MRSSYFIASHMLPQDVVVYVGAVGTCGTQLAPPGIGDVPSNAVIAGRPCAVRLWLISAAAAVKLLARM